MSFVLTYGPNRTRVKLGEAGILKLTEARAKARTILAERRLGQYRPGMLATKPRWRASWPPPRPRTDPVP
jgi:hypothetical protein